MTFKIGNIYIENFKSVEKAFLNFSEKDLIVLDGPNGFGKTTIFDAVELVLTGGIRRIENVKITDGKRGYDDFLFAKNQNLPIILKVELYDGFNKKRIVIGRKIVHSHLTRSKKKPQDFPSSLHLLSTFEDDLTDEKRA